MRERRKSTSVITTKAIPSLSLQPTFALWDLVASLPHLISTHSFFRKQGKAAVSQSNPRMPRGKAKREIYKQIQNLLLHRILVGLARNSRIVRKI